MFYICLGDGTNSSCIQQCSFSDIIGNSLNTGDRTRGNNKYIPNRNSLSVFDYIDPNNPFGSYRPAEKNKGNPFNPNPRAPAHYNLHTPAYNPDIAPYSNQGATSNSNKGTTSYNNQGTIRNDQGNAAGGNADANSGHRYRYIPDYPVSEFRTARYIESPEILDRGSINETPFPRVSLRLMYLQT